MVPNSPCKVCGKLLGLCFLRTVKAPASILVMQSCSGPGRALPLESKPAHLSLHQTSRPAAESGPTWGWDSRISCQDRVRVIITTLSCPSARSVASLAVQRACVDSSLMGFTQLRNSTQNNTAESPNLPPEDPIHIPDSQCAPSKRYGVLGIIRPLDPAFFFLSILHVGLTLWHLGFPLV
jgi:hypothetical protein